MSYDSHIHPKDRRGRWARKFVHDLKPGDKVKFQGATHTVEGKPQPRYASGTHGSSPGYHADNGHLVSLRRPNGNSVNAAFPKGAKVDHLNMQAEKAKVAAAGAAGARAGGAGKASPLSGRRDDGSGTVDRGSLTKAHSGNSSGADTVDPKDVSKGKPWEGTGYSQQEYRQRLQNLHRFYHGHVKSLAKGDDGLASTPSVGGPKIVKHEGQFLIEHPDDISENRKLWQQGKVPTKVKKAATPERAAAIAARMDISDYMKNRKAGRSR